MWSPNWGCKLRSKWKNTQNFLRWWKRTRRWKIPGLKKLNQIFFKPLHSNAVQGTMMSLKTIRGDRNRLITKHKCQKRKRVDVHILCFRVWNEILRNSSFVRVIIWIFNTSSTFSTSKLFMCTLEGDFSNLLVTHSILNWTLDGFICLQKICFFLTFTDDLSSSCNKNEYGTRVCTRRVIESRANLC
jgi:hypothetical protein